jgi:co-chaperonin GroES (HSP10)
MSQVATTVIEVEHKVDPKKVINDALKGWIDRIRPTSGDVLVCVYERPEKTKGNIIMPETASRRSEDKFQGVVGLIVKVGPEYGKHKQALGLNPMPQIGDWVAFRTQDCVSFVLGQRSMRLLQGDFIRLVLSDPDCII